MLAAWRLTPFAAMLAALLAAPAHADLDTAKLSSRFDTIISDPWVRSAPLLMPQAAPGPMRLMQPLPHLKTNSSFGWRFDPVMMRWRLHKGVDYAAESGTPIHAAHDGVVDSIGFQEGEGLYIRIRHDSKIETGYAHLSAFSHGLMLGSEVHCGDVIGAVGATGTTTGPHLHFEVFVRGEPVDPEFDSKDWMLQVAQAK